MFRRPDYCLREGDMFRMMRKQVTLFMAALTICAAAAIIFLLQPNAEPEEPILQFEAEAGVLNGVETSTSSEGFSGEGYVTGFDQPADSVSITVNAPEEGLYQMWVGYNGMNGEKFTQLSLNGQPFGDVKLQQTTTFEEVKAGKVLLRRGDNKLSFTSHWGWYDIDYVKLQRTVAVEPQTVEDSLVNPNASDEARALHRFLVEQYGKKILSGQQTYMDALLLNHNYGKLPAVVGFDLIEYSPTRVENGSKSSEIEDALDWHERGGIATFLWHWNAPADLINSADQPWWKGFYTEATTFDIERTLAEPDSEAYRLMLRDIDAIAEQLKRLQEAGVPVLWRPLHEAEGKWFWWGAKGPGPAKQLWRLLYDRLTNHHGLNNLIWVWNSESPEWYPGNDVVDIVSVDSYPLPGDYNPVHNRYENLVELVQHKKLVALTENGPIPDPDLLQKYGTHWSWFCTWTGDYIDDGIQNSKAHIEKVLKHEYVLTLDELLELR
jgi:mannan endo-1,4-beta-mannosidase